MNQPVYERIGQTYDETRQADSEITGQLITLLQPRPEARYLDIGCGSGNYTHALFMQSVLIEGIDISPTMLEKARKKYPYMAFHQGDATELLFADQTYDGAICIMATHHFGDYTKAFDEIYRVLKPGRFVIFTVTPKQMTGYWLSHYFPTMMQKSMATMANDDELSSALQRSGFAHVSSSPFFVSNQLQDWFLHAGKYRPEIYLNPAVRAGISSFQLFAEPAELEQGLNALSKDIETGAITDIIQRYENKLGDCLFITAEKN